MYNTQKKKIGILGFAFKEGTDDLRESPMVTLLETLIGKGFDVCIYDSSVVLSNLLGKNKDYINQHIPHISKLMVSSMNQIIDHAEVIVIGNKSKEFSNILDQITSDQIVIDFVRINSAITSSKNYQGICW